MLCSYIKLGIFSTVQKNTPAKNNLVKGNVINKKDKNKRNSKKISIESECITKCFHTEFCNISTSSIL